VEKTPWIAAFRARLEAGLEELSRESAAARSGTRVDGSHRPANRGERAAVTAQGYLTVGLERRRAELRGHLDHLAVIDPGPRDRVTPGALVRVEDEDGAQTLYLVLPGGQGARLEQDGVAVTVLSPGSPLARSLLGLSEGDAASLPRGEVEITAIW